MSRIVCDVCPHLCALEEEQTGFCGARSNQGGKISADSYGRVTAIALDPVEKSRFAVFFRAAVFFPSAATGATCGAPGARTTPFPWSGRGRTPGRSTFPRRFFPTSRWN
ncbi:hypothetical protein [Caproicibacter fermentans]|uniref:hypothetical protein n=1 Tax=Caproicibacter fermentans TaxID=2576756 RepID=UPI0038B37503